ncbi:MAG: CoA transferase [Pseudomonadota bacterium]
MTPAQHIAADLAAELGWPDAPMDRLSVTQSTTGLATWLPIADMAAGAQGLVGLAAAHLHEARGGKPQTVHVDRWAASLSMTSAAYLTVNGEQAVEWDPLTGYHQANDGWVYTHCQFEHLRSRLLAAFDLPHDIDAVKACFAQIPAAEIEHIAQEAGACGIAQRTRAAWQAHPQAAVLAKAPVVQLARAGVTPSPELPPAEEPLAGIRVLDLSRVIAGPTIGKTLGEHGAQVIRISAAHLPSFDSLVIDTGVNKRAAFVDLRTEEGHETLCRLITQADVLIDAYRPGSLAAKGFDEVALAKLNPSLVKVTLSAFGADGPWGGRRGYDTYVQSATGLTAGEDAPARLPCQPLDYLGGYLGAAAAMIALTRRMAEGGGWRAELSLARNAMWVWDQADRLGPEAAPPATNPSLKQAAPLLAEMETSFGRVCAMRPARSLSLTPPKWRIPPVPLGSDPPVWV